jgi:hypothetical protein
MWNKSKKTKKAAVSDESDLSFISKDDEDLYDPLNPDMNLNKRRYRYKSSSSEDL